MTAKSNIFDQTKSLYKRTCLQTNFVQFLKSTNEAVVRFNQRLKRFNCRTVEAIEATEIFRKFQFPNAPIVHIL